jgi:DNA polymerase-1
MRYNAIIVDQANLAHRTFHTAEGLSTEIDGVETEIGMVYGFVRSCLKLYDELAAAGEDNCVFLLADEDHADERKRIWDGYKAGRSPHTESYDRQRDILRDLIFKLGWGRVTSPGWEADDVCATLAKGFEGRIAIVTGDHDLHQCVTEEVHVVDPNSKKHDLQDGRAWRRRDVEHKWGVTADKIKDVKALAGDTSDGYPGAPRVGDKIATALVRAYGSLTGVIEAANLNEKLSYFVLSPEREEPSMRQIRSSVILDIETELMTFLDLATLRDELPLNFAARSRTPNPEAEFRRLKFFSLLAPAQLKLARRVAGYHV